MCGVVAKVPIVVISLEENATFRYWSLAHLGHTPPPSLFIGHILSWKIHTPNCRPPGYHAFVWEVRLPRPTNFKKNTSANFFKSIWTQILFDHKQGPVPKANKKSCVNKLTPQFYVASRKYDRKYIRNQRSTTSWRGSVCFSNRRPEDTRRSAYTQPPNFTWR